MARYRETESQQSVSGRRKMIKYEDQVIRYRK